MEDNDDFFGDVFDDPEDDPLIGGSDSDDSSSGYESDESASGSSEHGPPSWMSEERVNGHGSSEESAGSGSQKSDSGPAQKTVIVDQSGDQTDGLDELNEAVGEGWRLVRITLSRSDQNGSERTDRAEKFVAVLEQEGPQSLFDFGAA